jgi:hypothetical protein
MAWKPRDWSRPQLAFPLMPESSHETKGVVLQGRVIDKVLNEGTAMQRHFVALEREPGGQFLALHNEQGRAHNFHDLVGKWVEVEGHVWFQSLVVRTVVELDNTPG